MEWRTDNGVIREEIVEIGLHDVVMGHPVITMAVVRSLGLVIRMPTQVIGCCARGIYISEILACG
jgi:hypothetical protein